jgi:hypothetical protein
LADRVVNTTINIGANTAELSRVLDLLRQIGKAAGGIGGVGLSGGGAGGGGGVPGAATGQSGASGGVVQQVQGARSVTQAARETVGVVNQAVKQTQQVSRAAQEAVRQTTAATSVAVSRAQISLSQSVGAAFRNVGGAVRDWMIGAGPESVQPDINGREGPGFSDAAIARMIALEQRQGRRRQILFGGGKGGRGGARLGGRFGNAAKYGVAGLVGYQALQAATQAGQQYIQAGVGQAQGLYSGNALQAAQAQVQFEASREQALQSAVGSGVGGAAGAGGMLAGFAIGGPVGAAVAAIGILTQSIVSLATTAANTSTQIEAVKKQSALGLFGTVYERRSGLIQAQMGTAELIRGRGQRAALGGAISDESLKGYARDWMLNPQEATGRLRGLIGAGGSAYTDANRVFGMERRYGVGADVVGRFQRAFLPGAGAAIPGVSGAHATAAASTDLMERVLAGATRMGIQQARLPEYMGRVAQSNESMAEKGLIINPKSAEELRQGLTGAGLQGFQPQAVAENMQNVAGGLQASLTNMRMPQEVVTAILRTGLAEQFGGDIGAQSAGLTGLRKDPKALAEFLVRRSKVAGAGQKFFLSQVSGMVPEAAGALADYAPGTMAEAAVTKPGEWEKQLGLTAGQAKIVGTRAIMEAEESLGVSLPLIAKHMDDFREVLQAKIEAFKRVKIGELFGETMDALRTKTEAGEDILGRNARSRVLATSWDDAVAYDHRGP